jgi:hypothetical protein
MVNLPSGVFCTFLLGKDLIVIMILLLFILILNILYMSSAMKYTEIQTFVVCVLLYMIMGLFCNVFVQKFIEDSFVFCDSIVRCIHCTTGRQLPPLSSVPYRIISKRRYILAAQLLLGEKSGT